MIDSNKVGNYETRCHLGLPEDWKKNCIAGYAHLSAHQMSFKVYFQYVTWTQATNALPQDHCDNVVIWDILTLKA